ncbi:MAG: ribosome maturation factor RimM [Christensenellales bacterium]|jgi:16S rRNA processing protein RimM
MSRLAPYLVIARVLKPQGIAGELKLKPITDDAERFLSLRHVFVPAPNDQMKKLKFRALRVHDGFVYAKLEGVFTRDDAEKMRDVVLYIDRDNAVELPEGRYFVVDLMGCTVLDSKGEALGTLKEIIQTGANDVYIIQGENGQWMLPALKKLLKRVDVEEGVVQIDESGLLEVDEGAY